MMAPSGREMEARATPETRLRRDRRRARPALRSCSAAPPLDAELKSISASRYLVDSSAPWARLWRQAASRSTSALAHSSSIMSHMLPRSRTAISGRVGIVLPGGGGVALGCGVRRTSHPRSSAYFLKSSRRRRAAASLSRTLGDRSSASAQRMRPSSCSGVSIPASGAGCLDSRLKADTRNLSQLSTAAPSSDVVQSAPRHGAYGEASKAAAAASEAASISTAAFAALELSPPPLLLLLMLLPSPLAIPPTPQVSATALSRSRAMYLRS
mmetsp:Transcript_31788/g.78745  ORF Transcript_31788/g.78745 Transcript_31788/m.78745 type:complete len:269 (-) Transcript_31788:238-1044(-)